MPLYRADNLDIPTSVPPIARFGTGTPGRISNGLSIGSSINVPANTMSVFPIYIPQAMTLDGVLNPLLVADCCLQMRTSGSNVQWSGTQAARTFTFRLYAPGTDNLPAAAITNNGTFEVPANITSNSNFTFGPPTLSVPAGWIWMGFAAHNNAIELAGISTSPASFEGMMFSKFTGTGANQTSNYYSFATATDTSFLPPESLASRTVDLAATTASQTTLRTRTGAPMLWLYY